MEVKGHYAFPNATVERVWDLLMDPDTIAACVPGCAAFTALGDDRYRIVLTAAVAAVSGSFSGTVVLSDKQPRTSYRLIVEASGKAGFASGESVFTLTPAVDGARVDVVSTMAIGGLVAQVGQRLLSGTARLMMDRFFACLRSKV